MFDAPHPRIGSLFDSHRARNVSSESQANLWRFLGNCEKDVARRVVMDLDKVNAQFLQVMNGDSGFCRVLGWSAVGEPRRRIVEHWAG